MNSLVKNSLLIFSVLIFLITDSIANEMIEYCDNEVNPPSCSLIPRDTYMNNLDERFKAIALRK